MFTETLKTPESPADLDGVGGVPSPRLGLRQIAALCGASRSTVALALKDSPRVTPKLKAKIREVAGRLGYAPNPYVSDVMSSIARGRWRARGRTLAIVVDGASSVGGIRALCRAVEGAAERLGAAVCVLHLREAKATEELARVIEARRISGAVLIGFNSPPRFEHRLPNLSFVTLGCTAARPHTTAIRHDRCHAIQLATESVGAMRYARPFLVTFAADGVTGGHEILGGIADVNSLSPPNLSCGELTARVAKWIAERNPDVILGFGDGTHELIRHAGCRLPYVDLEHASNLACQAAVVPDFDGMGRIAAELVLAASCGSQQGSGRPTGTILVPGRLRTRIAEQVCAS